MILALGLVGAALLVLPGLGRRPPYRLPVREWAPVATAALLIGAAAVELALVLIAVPTVAHATGLSALADACHGALAPLPNPPPLVGWLAGVASLALGIAVIGGTLRSWMSARRARVEPWLGHHALAGGFEVVVLPTSTPIAYGTPGPCPQVVVSQGLVERLSNEGLKAVLAHERAHHHLSHTRYLAFLAGLERALGRIPAVRRSTAAIRDALEVWADEAATEQGAAPADLYDALVSLGAPTHLEVRERCRRLRRGVAPRPTVFRALAYSPVVILSTVAGVLAVDWLTAAHHAGALGASCV